MDSGTHRASSAVIGVVLLIVGLAVGFGVTKAMDHNDNNNSGNSSNSSMTSSANSSKASDLRANLVSIGGQHVQLADIALDAAMDGSPYAGAAKSALVKNGEELSAAIGSVYGKDAQTKFQALWNRHLNDFVDYAVAAKGGDAAGKTKAVNDLNAYSEDVATFLSGANPNLPKDVVKQAFKDHLNQITGMIDAHVAGNYAKEFSLREQAVDHLKGVDSTLAAAIVKQFPDKFQN